MLDDTKDIRYRYLMNNEILVYILLALVVILLVLIAFIGTLGWRFLKQQNNSQSIQENPIADVPDLRSSHNPKKSDSAITKHELNKDLLKSLRSKGKAAQNNFRPAVCSDHPDRGSYGTCALSGDQYCEECLSKSNEIVIAKKFMEFFHAHEWKQILMMPSGDINHDVSTRIQKIKDELWKNKEIPLIVQAHHKINVEDDKIESFTVILARLEDTSYIKKELSFLQ